MAERLLGVLASGSGTNFRAVDDAINKGWLGDTRIAVLITDQPEAGARTIARARGIPEFCLKESDNETRNATIADIFQAKGVELGIAAGYLKRIGGEVLAAYPDEILNIHPAPLPRFGGNGMYGLRAHQAVIDARARWSGPTVHIVDDEYDHGQILGHIQVPVFPGDTAKILQARVLPVEHDLYWRVIKQQLERGAHPEG